MSTAALMAHCRAALIDLDGTLCDTLGDFVQALSLTLADLQLPAVPRAFIERTIGKGSEHLLRSTLAEVGAEAGRYDDAWASYQRRYAEINGLYTQLYPGAREGLQALRARGWPLACVTNKPTAFASVLLARTGLAAQFDEVCGGDRYPRRKPDPMPLVETCRRLGAEPARTLMVGDSRNDAEAARAAGCPVVLVTYGYNHGEPVRGVPADGYIDRIDALV